MGVKNLFDFLQGSVLKHTHTGHISDVFVHMGHKVRNIMRKPGIKKAYFDVLNL